MNELEVYKKAYRIRCFETQVYNAVKDGRVKCPVYLSRGQEIIPATLSELLGKDYMLFTQHRCHGYYLAFGGDPKKLRDELLGLETGCCQGKAGSNCIQIHENGIDMYGHHGLVGENVAIGVGAALASGRKTLCVFGDGAAEEDYVLASIGLASTHKLPVLFICEDNDKAVLTPKSDRRSWSITDVARGFGVDVWHGDDRPYAIQLAYQHIKLPALLNVDTERIDWHVGAGTEEVKKDSLVNFKKTLPYFKCFIRDLEYDIKKEMEELWNV
jgi:pyruvate dehydrogenase E1 component alpha subunit